MAEHPSPFHQVAKRVLLLCTEIDTTWPYRVYKPALLYFSQLACCTTEAPRRLPNLVPKPRWYLDHGPLAPAVNPLSCHVPVLFRTRPHLIQLHVHMLLVYGELVSTEG